MAGEINFGLLDTNMPAKVGNAFFQGQQEAAQLQAAKNQNKLADFTLQDKARALADQNALTTAIQQNYGPNGVDHAGVMNTLARTGSGHLVQQYQDQVLANQKTQSDIGKGNAEASKNNAEALVKATASHRDDLAGVSDPTSAAAWVTAGYKDPVIGPVLSRLQPLETALANVPTDPTKFEQWKQQNALGANEFIKRNTITADEKAKNVTSIQTAGMNNATSRANNQANIAKDLTVAGIGQDGGPNANTQSMVDAIGQYKVQPPNGMALRNPRMQGILAEVTKQYPDFDATTYGAKQQAVKSYAAGGKNSDSIQAGNTALNHLETLKELADAQNNGDMRLFNQIANKFATETGGPAPTNLQGAITMVGPEISKAVIGSGGTGGDREKVDKALDAIVKGGPAQAAGQIATMKELFGGRLSESKRTYERSTGRKDFESSLLSPAARAVLSARSGQSVSGNNGLPNTNSQGWALHVDAKGNKAYVSPDGKQFQEVQ